MNIRTLVFAMAFGFAAGARGDEVQLVSREPDHLIPVNPYPGEARVRYAEELRSRFKLTPHYFAQMLVHYTNYYDHGEYVIRLHGEDEKPFEKTGKFFLTYSIAERSIWMAMPEHNDEKKQRDVRITVTTVEFPKPLAQRVHELWRRVLLRTRYADGAPRERVVDTTFEFSLPGLYGEAWSRAERNSATLLSYLADSLSGYCGEAPERRGAAIKLIEYEAARLEKYLDEHPAK